MTRRFGARAAVLLIVAAGALAIGAPAASAITWNLPAIDLLADGYSGMEDGPQIAVAPDGTTTIVWDSFREVAPDEYENNILVRTRPAGEEEFRPAQVLSEPGENAQMARVAMAADGTTTVVWQSYDTESQNEAIWASTRPADGDDFGAPEILSGDYDAEYPDLAVASDGTTTVVWRNEDGSIEAVTRPAVGDDFGDPETLSFEFTFNYDPRVATSPDGNTTTVVWHDSDNFVLAATRAAPATTFVDREALTSGSDYSIQDPDVAIGADGTTTVVWRQAFDRDPGPGADYRVLARTRPAGETWAAIETLSSTDEEAGAPQVAAGPGGAATVVWQEGLGTPQLIKAATRPANEAVFGTPDLIASGDQVAEPYLAIGPDGTTTVVWTSYIEFEGNPSYGIQTSTRPGGGTQFGDPEALTQPGGFAGEPRVAVAANGSFTATWRRSPGGVADPIVQTVSSEGEDPPPFTRQLSVTKSGTGEGTVTSTPAGIDCGSTCQADFDDGASVTLAATAASGSSFTGWSGSECSGTGTCVVTMSEARSVTATFTTDTPPPPPPPGKPKLRLSVKTPKKAKAGKSFRVTVRTSNVAENEPTRAVRVNGNSSPTTATDVKTCVKLSKGLFIVKSGGGKVKGRTVCWTRSSLAAGRSTAYTVTVRSAKTRSGSLRVSGTASASNDAGEAVKTTGSGKVRIVKPKTPKPKPPTG